METSDRDIWGIFRRKHTQKSPLLQTNDKGFFKPPSAGSLTNTKHNELTKHFFTRASEGLAMIPWVSEQLFGHWTQF